MNKINKFILSLLLCNIANASANEPSNSQILSPPPPYTVMILFYPPAGREQEFLNTFVKQQAAYMRSYATSNPNSKSVESYNIAPIKTGEPLVHLMIYRDTDAYEKAVNIFSSRENLYSYMSEHANLYDGEKLGTDILKNSKVHFGELINQPKLQ